MLNKATSNGSFSDLVKALPEVYQPIFGHPEFSKVVSRDCEDRLVHLLQNYRALEKQLKRSLRVLDLGCAQGFFSFNLAKLGAQVHGVDSLDANIAVCRVLMREHSKSKVSFEVARIEDVLARLVLDQYDLVLGLSVFHHIVHEVGIPDVQEMLTGLSTKVAAGIFELALNNEPLYWGPSQPQDPRLLLEGFAFVHELARHKTHLSDINRPLYIASSRYWFLNEQIGRFDSWQVDSHMFAKGTHQGTRRYFFGEGSVVKLFRLDHATRLTPNLDEYNNEVNFLSNPPMDFNAPCLLLHGRNEYEAWLVREQLPGELLVDMISSGKSYDAKLVLKDILAQLVTLESVGLYHNDIRVWNVLIGSGGHASLIDYGAITKNKNDCICPRDIFLAFFVFIHEVGTGKIETPIAPRMVTTILDQFEPPYRNLVFAFFSTPVVQWSFKLMEQLYILLNNAEENKEIIRDFIKDKSAQAAGLIVKLTAVIGYNAQLHFQLQQLQKELNVARIREQNAKAKTWEIEYFARGRYNKLSLYGVRCTWSFRKDFKPTLADVVAAYHYFLERKPENVSVVIGHMQSKTINDLINSFKGSIEFQGRSNSSVSSRYKLTYIVNLLWVRPILVSIKKKGICLAKKLACGILAVSLQGIRSMPPLKTMLSSVARRFPSVGARFLSFAAAHPRPPKVTLPTRRYYKPAVIQLQHVPALAQRRSTTYLTKTKRVLYCYVDHTVGCCVNTGMQRVARSLARGLIEAGENVIFVRWCPELKALVKINQIELTHFCKWQGPVINQQIMSTYPVPDAPKEPINNLECSDDSWLVVPEVTHINFHGYSPTLDVLMKAREAKLKTAFIFYDAIPLRCEEFKNIASAHSEYMQHLLLADLVVSISRWSARDLISFFIQHEKSALTVIPFVEPLLLPGETRLTESSAKPSMATQKIILSVGTIERHKNQGVLLAAFEAFCVRHPHADWKLVLVGNLHENMATKIHTAISRNKNIVYRGNISDEDLDELYRVCAFTVFPSYEEGFGLPIVESLNYGKPCICADFGAMAEAAKGGGCLEIDVRDAGKVEDAISTLINDPDKLRKLEQEAKNRKKVTWSNYTNDFRSLLDSVTMAGNKIGKIFYLVHHTCVFPYNTGIQRVARNLARALIEIGLDVVPVKWNINTGFFVSPTDAELLHLAQWNGPQVDDWTSCDLKTFKPADWLFIPEIISASSAPSIATIIEAAHASGLRTAAIFFDAIPYKMQNLYPLQATKAHSDYMCAINDSDLVFSISEHSNADLLKFLQSQTYLHTPNLFERLRVAFLPGEFTESPRNLDVKPASETIRILCVGTVEPRKNHLKLLKAFAMVQRRLPADKRVELFIVGSAPFSGLEKEIQNLMQIIPAVQWERETDDSRLHELYRSSDFTIYPSLEEGFGLPILESLWNARPCICRNASSMMEIAENGGGCLMVDTSDIDEFALAIERLIVDEELRLKLAQEAVSRPFKKWRDYAEEIVKSLAEERVLLTRKSSVVPVDESSFRANMTNLEKRPLLSICITTYNRAEWLSLNLKNLSRLLPTPIADVEIVVCDNASTDHTNEIVKSYEFRQDFSYYRNQSNVGMLGNLRVTAHHARGQYIWIIGDDDLVAPGAIEKVLMAIRQNSNVALLYLNYAYTREENAKRVTDLSVFFKHATPITKPTIDKIAPISELSMLSENLFTAIYCLVFRRDHALRAYTQDTSGRPFSTMLTCMPTTYYVLHNMMDEKGVWLGTPQIVVNMNVSWLKYASLWILERIPEALDLAEKMGALHKEVDKRRIAHLPQIWYWLGEIIKNDSEKNAIYFNPARLFSRFKHLSEFQSHIPEFIEASRKIGPVYPTCFTKPSEDSFSVSSAK